MTAYAQQLASWSAALSAGRAEVVLDHLAQDSVRRDVERFLENAIGERYRLLMEETDLVALAFDDFDRLLDEYLSQTPRQTFSLHERDQQRFLRWLRGRGLTPQQADYVTCQEAEYACYELARRHRAACLEFQRRWNASRPQVEEQIGRPNCRVLVNPVHVWARLEVAANDGDGEPRTGNVIFLAIDQEIRSLWLTRAQESAARTLSWLEPLTLATWRARHGDLHPKEHAEICREFVAGGLVALC